MAFRIYNAFRNMVASAIVGDMSDMNPRIWEGQFFSAKESPALTPGTFRNRRRTSSITVWLPRTGKFTKRALVKLIMAECQTLGAIFSLFSDLSQQMPKNLQRMVSPSHLHFPHPPPHQIRPCQGILERSVSLFFELDGQVHHAQSHYSKS